METAARRRALQIAARALEQRLNADLSDYAGPSVACTCGATARYVDRRSKLFETVLGALRLERAYYHCASCRQGFCPRDQALSLADTSVSPAVTRMTGQAASMVSFQESSDLLWQLAGVKANAKQVERIAEALGREISADESQVAETYSEPALPPTAYLGLDGTGVPMRASELLGRPGKQPDGSAKTREVKLCTIFTAESRDGKGKPVRDEGSVSYSAAIESAANLDTDKIPSPFAGRVLREAQRRGFDSVRRQVILGDGAAWIWKLAEMHFPDALQVVDR